MDEGLQLFTMGIWVIALAYLTSTIGVFVGVTSARKVRTASTDGLRIWWLVVATLVSGGVGVWLAQFLPMAGFGVEGSMVRYDVASIAFSMTVALVSVFIALLVVTPVYGGGSTGRTVVGALVLGAGLAGVYFTILWSVQISGTIEYSLPMVLATIVLAMATAVGFLWQVLNADSWPKRLVMSAVAGAAVVGVYFVGVASIRVDVDPSFTTPEGFEVFSILFPLFVVGLLLLAVPIVAVLLAPDRVAAELESESERWAASGTDSSDVDYVS